MMTLTVKILFATVITPLFYSCQGKLKTCSACTRANNGTVDFDMKDMMRELKRSIMYQIQISNLECGKGNHSRSVLSQVQSALSAEIDSKLSAQEHKIEAAIKSGLQGMNETISVLSTKHTDLQANVESLIQRIEQLENTTAKLVNPKDCSELPEGSIDGVYMIYPDCPCNGFKVYCKDKWTVMQRRQDSNVDFNRPWIDYKTGFGDVEGNYWLGNDNLHLLTRAKKYRLRIEMTDKDLEQAHAIYNSFSVGNADSRYTLSVSGYSGTAGDAMGNVNGMAFTTKDQDNDQMNFNCATSYQSGFWFNACGICNPNGRYILGQTKHYSMFWRPWRSEACLKTFVMMVR